MLHRLPLCKRLQLQANHFVLMHPIGRFIVTVMAEPYLETEPFRFIPERTAENVMPFKPLP
jgi:hypothetical protein